jgi:hypothetical protein
MRNALRAVNAEHLPGKEAQIPPARCCTITLAGNRFIKITPAISQIQHFSHNSHLSPQYGFPYGD